MELIVDKYARNYTSSDRISQRRKNANDFQWYKDKADDLDSHAFHGANNVGYGGISEYYRKKVNYDLFNNIINIKDFEYVCKPFGAEGGELPANFANRDIVSGKIKVLLGMEMKMPFSWKVVAVNEDATTRKEQEETKRIKDYVVSEVMRPIQTQIEQQKQAEIQGKELSPEELQQIQQDIAQQVQAETPDEVRKYMAREHQDPAEILIHQILEYLTQKEQISNKFNKGFKHLNLSAEEIFCVGIINTEPSLRVVNPLRFRYGKSDDSEYVQDAEWWVEEIPMTPSQVVSTFNSKLTNAEIDRIYDRNTNSPSEIRDEDFTFDDNLNDTHTIRVVHFVWKSLRKIGFLDYFDERMKPQTMLVDENYTLNKSEGDLKLEWEWIPECHEVYKVLDDIYPVCRPVPGQYKNLDNLYDCTGPYIGATCDDLNSLPTSPMDRMKTFQYLYDIIIYRIELLLASDKGKILAANINAIPQSAGIDTAKWMYFIEANKIAFFNPGEEGNKGAGDVTNMVKEIDMTMASNINTYIQIAEYIESKCGSSIGVTPQMEAQISAKEAVSNTKQNLIQSSHIVQPYYELHNIVKAQVLTKLIDTAKVAYSSGRQRKLSYFLDDMSLRTLLVDQGLLESSEYGLFVANASKAHDAKQAVETLAQAALQTQQADLGDIIKVIRSDSITEAEELLESARMRKQQETQQAEMQKLQMQDQLDKRQGARRMEERTHEKEMIILKEEEKRKTIIQQQTIESMGFNEDKDLDNDRIPDVLEVAKFGVDANIREKELDLQREQFEHQKNNDSKKNELDNKKLSLDKKKLSQQGKNSSKAA